MHGRSTSFHKDIKCDNEWVVAYNPHQLRMVSRHISAQIFGSTKGEINYLFKYVCKGHNRFTMHIKENNEAVYDKVQNYQDCRYIGRRMRSE